MSVAIRLPERDVLVAEVPLVFRQSELYVTACLAGICAYLLLAALGLKPEIASLAGIVVIAAIRIASIRHGITLPVLQIPPRTDS